MPSIPQIAAFIAGLLGSGHCALMCGGIAGALGLSTPAAAARAGRPLLYPFLYNTGRVTSYTLAGAIVGAIGGGAMALAGLPPLRLAFTGLAAMMIVIVGLRFSAGARHFAWLDRLGLAAWRRIAPWTRWLFPIRTPQRAFAAGMVWGWLPCGMAYAMLTAAWLTADPLQGATLMLMFGIGTLPALLALGAGAARLLSPSTQRFGGAVLVAIGLASVIVPLWPGAGGHSHHHYEGSSGDAIGVGATGSGFTGELAKLFRIEDPDHLALDLDHAELGKAGKESAHGLDHEPEVVGEVPARHRQHEQVGVAPHALQPLGQ